MRTQVGVVLLFVLTCAAAMPAAAAAAPPVNVAPPAIDDTTPVVGETLTAGGDAWDDAGSTVAYQWLRCAATDVCAEIPAATDTSYTVVADDVGSALQVRAIATNADGPSQPSESAQTEVVPGVAPENTAPPTVTGTPRRGEVLTAHHGTWTGTPAPDLTYQWLRCDPAGNTCASLAGATGDTYQVGTSDGNHTFRVRETATNVAGSASKESDPTGLVPAAVKNLTVPTISGTPRAGMTLTGTAGSWSGTSPSITHQWRRCNASGTGCVSIPGATGLKLLLGAADQGHTIRLRETATNDAGTSSVSSAPTALVPVPVSNASPPLISGAPVVGASVVSSIGDWNGTTPILLTRRWQRCDAGGCADIPGAMSDVYILQPADLGRSIRLVVHASNDGGAATAVSALLGPVTNGAVPPPPAAPTASTSSAALAAAFDAPRTANLGKALAGRYKTRAECTGPCRLRVRLIASKAVARKWRVPRTLASGRRNLIAAGTATIRPHFSKKTRSRLKPVKKLVVVLVAEARDGSGKLVSRRTFKVTLRRAAATTRGTF